MSTYTIRELQRLYRDDYDLPKSFSVVEGVYREEKLIPSFVGTSGKKNGGRQRKLCEWCYINDDNHIVGPLAMDVMYRDYTDGKLENVKDKDNMSVSNRKDESTFKPIEDWFLKKEFAFLFNPELNKYIADKHSYANDGDPVHKIFHDAEFSMR